MSDNEHLIPIYIFTPRGQKLFFYDKEANNLIRRNYTIDIGHNIEYNALCSLVLDALIKEGVLSNDKQIIDVYEIHDCLMREGYYEL